MKRLIKYHSHYNEIKFSDCSTRYEILEYLVDDSAGNKELRDYADALGYERVGNVKVLVKELSEHHSSLMITHSVKLNETVQGQYAYSDKEYQVYLGFITIDDRVRQYDTNFRLLPIESINNIINDDLAREIVCNQEYGVSDVAKIGDDMYMIMEGWNYYHDISMLGYSLSEFEKHFEVQESTFSDEVSSCHECGEWMSDDNGCTYNYRIVGCTLLGLECGCYHKHAKDNYMDVVNNGKEFIELDVAKELEDEGKLEFVERFIGGMTDGRGCYYNGEDTREGEPSEILKELLNKSPNNNYIFTHDESGQFQTYFSVWRVIKTKLKIA